MKKLVFDKYLLTLLTAGVFLPISIGAQTMETPSVTPTPLLNAVSTESPSAPVTWEKLHLPGIPLANFKPEAKFLSPFRFEVSVFIIRTPEEWQMFYEPRYKPDSPTCDNSFKAPDPPVDFKTTMIIVCEYQGCFDVMSFANFSMSSTGCSVSLEDYQVSHVCFSLSDPGSMTAIAVPTTKLPITLWDLKVRKDEVNN